MSVNLRNVSGVERVVDGRTVDTDEVLSVDGALAPKSKQPADGVLIGEGDDARVWPAAHWALEGTSDNEEN